MHTYLHTYIHTYTRTHAQHTCTHVCRRNVCEKDVNAVAYIGVLVIRYISMFDRCVWKQRVSAQANVCLAGGRSRRECVHNRVHGARHEKMVITMVCRTITLFLSFASDICITRYMDFEKSDPHDAHVRFGDGALIRGRCFARSQHGAGGVPADQT
jgi:hypothetical protein